MTRVWKPCFTEIFSDDYLCDLFAAEFGEFLERQRQDRIHLVISLYR